MSLILSLSRRTNLAVGLVTDHAFAGAIMQCGKVRIVPSTGRKHNYMSENAFI
jgi:hypothetical protein